MKQEGGEEWHRLVLQGKIATDAHRAGGRSFRVVTVANTQVPLPVQSQLQRMRQDVCSTDSQVCDTLATRTPMSLGGLDKHIEELQSITRSAKQVALAESRADQDNAEAIVQWSVKNSKSPTCPQCPRDLVVVPLVGEVQCIDVATSVLETRRQALAGGNSRLPPSLRRHFEQMHTIIRHSERRPIPRSLERKKKASSGRCKQAHMCLCNRPVLDAFTSAWQKTLRTALKPQGCSRKITTKAC